jgi:hypothetical protein
MRQFSVHARTRKPRSTEAGELFYVETILAQTQEQAEIIFAQERWCFHEGTFEVLIAPLIEATEAECPK